MLAAVQLFYAVQGGMVLYLRSNNMAAAQVADGGINSSIAAFCATGGKEDLSRVCIQDLSYRFTGIFYTQPGFPPVGVNRGRIAEMICHVRQHCIQHGLIQRCGSCIVEVNSFQGVDGGF